MLWSAACNVSTRAIVLLYPNELLFVGVFSVCRYLSKGLEHFDAVFFLPIYNAFLIVLSILAGAIYFDEARTVITIWHLDSVF